MVPSPLMKNHPVKCVAVMGATATGKSALAIQLAGQVGGEVVSMDSRQVYRGMDIGTGKVTAEECHGIPHHLLDILEPSETGNAGRHAEMASKEIEAIASKGNVPLLVGGTALYFDALLQPLIEVDIPAERLEAIRAQFKARATLELYAELRSVDPERAKRLSPNDRVRITRALEIYAGTGRPMSEHLSAGAARSAGGEKLSVLKLVLTMPRERLRARIADRTRAMYSAGWADEVQRLLDAGHRPDGPGMRGIGYGEISSALLAGSDPNGTVDEVIVRTQQYAKRQETFFRKYNGAVWLDVTGDESFAEAAERVTDFLA